MQPQERFVSSPATHCGHTCLGTLVGTVGGFFAESVRKAEGTRGKATVSLTVAFFNQRTCRWRECGLLPRAHVARASFQSADSRADGIDQKPMQTVYQADIAHSRSASRLTS